jgi:hypothetical protein
MANLQRFMKTLKALTMLPAAVFVEQVVPPSRDNNARHCIDCKLRDQNHTKTGRTCKVLGTGLNQGQPQNRPARRCTQLCSRGGLKRVSSIRGFVEGDRSVLERQPPGLCG